MSKETSQRKEKEGKIKKDAEELEQVIKESEKELLMIQKNCKHPENEHKLKDVNPEGTADIRNTCGLCGLLLGYPSKEQMDKWTGAKK